MIMKTTHAYCRKYWRITIIFLPQRANCWEYFEYFLTAIFLCILSILCDLLMRQMSWSGFFYHNRMSVLSLTQLTLPHRTLPRTGNLGQPHSGPLSEVLAAHCCWIVTKTPLRGRAWEEESLKDVALLDYTSICSSPLLKHIIKDGSVRTHRAQCLLWGPWVFLILGIHQYTQLFSSLCIGCWEVYC